MGITNVQALAIEHTGSDLLISAGAGSGKTFTLTQRIVERINAGKDISRMLIVTFTKEAANELKTRISTALFNLYKENPSDKLSEQIVKVNSADISTIDSFCYKIVKSNFDKLGLESGIRIGNKGELDILARETMGEVIDDFYDSPMPDDDFYLVVDCYSDNKDDEALKDNLLKLYEDLSNTADFLEGLKVPATMSGDFLDTKYGKVLKKHTKEMLLHYKATYDYLIDYIKGDPKGEKKFILALSGDLNLIERALNGIDNWDYKTLCNIFAGYSPEKVGNHSLTMIDGAFVSKIRTKFKKDLIELRDEYYSSDEGSIKIALEQNNRICGAMYRVLSSFDEKFRRKKAMYSVCSFNDISRYTLNLLYGEDGAVTSLAREIADRYDEIYIDEYQDTNSLQDSIFKAISNNNRFMVGDIKQSIYKFRLAEPEIFDHYKTTFPDKELNPADDGQGKSLFMSENFRCNRDVISFTNMVSDYMFEGTDGISYQPKDRLIYAKEDDKVIDEPPCQICLFDNSDMKDNEDKEEDYVLAQARFVAKTIKQTLAKGIVLPNGKPLSKSDFAILLRSTKYGVGERFARVLSDFGLSAEVSAEVGLFEKPLIRLMISLLNAIDNPYNDIYLAGIMRSPVFDFSLDEMVKIRSLSRGKDFALFSAALEYKGERELTSKVKAFVDTLNGYRDAVKRLTAHEAVYYVMTETGICSQVSREDRQDLIKLYDKARAFESGTFKGLYKFLAYVRDNMDSTFKETASSGTDNVQIMTIHASKGIEFEYCFVCNLEARCDKPTKSSLIYERSLGIAGHISKDEGIIKYNTLMRKCIDLQKHRSAKDEEMRVIYVAMTRARTGLYLTASLPEPLKHYEGIVNQARFVSTYQIYSTVQDIDFILGGATQPQPFYELQILNPLDMPKAPSMVSSTEPDEGLVKEYVEILKERLEFDYKYKHLSKMPSKLSVSKLEPLVLDGTDNKEVKLDKALDNVPKFMSKDDPEITAAEKGTATHVFMQFCDFSSLEKIGFKKELERLVEDKFIDEKTAQLINEDHIEKFRGSSLLKEIIKSKRVKREFRFNLMLSAEEFTADPELKTENVLVQGVVDCLFEDENGNLVLVDYKTDKVTMDNYVEVLTKRHETQLKYYKRACQLMFDKPISRVIIYSVPLAKNVELRV
ncbi:MAG: UvrD-helicase domain-containing protein [Clostridia bacterium]|nr:UvrD-helicase domain-containing protein [Clostridia bacterium]